MADIDVGAYQGLSTTAGSFTFVNLVNPSNGAGNIDYIKVKLLGASVTIDFASWYFISGSTYATRGYVEGLSLATGDPVELYAPGDFAEFAIETGDFIGGYCTAGFKYRTAGGFGMRYSSGDKIPTAGQSLSYLGAYQFDLYAEGTFVSAGPLLGAVMLVS